MKTTKKRYLVCLTIISALSLTLFSSCQTAGDDTLNGNLDSADTTTQIDSETEPEDPYAKYNDELGEYDFGGEEFKIRTFENENIHNRVDTDEANGDGFNDALYDRNRKIEERFNVVIKEQLVPDFTNADAIKVILAGDSTAFDLLVSRCTDGFTNWQEGLVLSFDDIPNIDLSKPYWRQSVNKTLTLGGNQYVAIGDFNFSTYELSHALLFNKSLIEDFALENPYNLVSGGQWTFDKMEEMMKPVINDLNGDGIKDENDRYGYLTHPKQVLAVFWIAADTFSVGKDDNDIPYLAMGNEKFMNVFEKTFSMLWDSGAYYLGTGGPDIPEYAIKMFANNQSLFQDTSLFVIEKMRSVEAEFGIIPYPKYDEAQKNHVSRVSYYMTVQVPITNPDLARAGVMLEALNSESSKTIVPAYYEVALKTKFARDNESSQMLDLILNTLVVDIGDTTLCDKIRDGFMADMWARNDRNLASKIESTQNIIQAFVEKIPVQS
jgi:hypothetical protein